MKNSLVCKTISLTKIRIFVPYKQTKTNDMIYLRKKTSGNFEISDKENATEKFKTQKAFKLQFNDYSVGKIIKAKYSRSQTYFGTVAEFLKFIK